MSDNNHLDFSWSKSFWHILQF